MFTPPTPPSAWETAPSRSTATPGVKRQVEGSTGSGLAGARRGPRFCPVSTAPPLRPATLRLFFYKQARRGHGSTAPLPYSDVQLHCTAERPYAGTASPRHAVPADGMAAVPPNGAGTAGHPEQEEVHRPPPPQSHSGLQESVLNRVTVKTWEWMGVTPSLLSGHVRMVLPIQKGF
ncbi:hypothetical protein AAFF_G00262980 [Aldrovandia affinis]|uniref:Uncharacterized protein n=1 Tax=Aldrovandia affinis TaxID=143900 RepID=A0AAD7ST13_9TELE|nr:hypothetical protein AAFF_G00262980 [Aldrovandia affinis]